MRSPELTDDELAELVIRTSSIMNIAGVDAGMDVAFSVVLRQLMDQELEKKHANAAGFYPA